MFFHIKTKQKQKTKLKLNPGAYITWAYHTYTSDTTRWWCEGRAQLTHNQPTSAQTRNTMCQWCTQLLSFCFDSGADKQPPGQIKGKDQTLSFVSLLNSIGSRGSASRLCVEGTWGWRSGSGWTRNTENNTNCTIQNLWMDGCDQEGTFSFQEDLQTLSIKVPKPDYTVDLNPRKI